MVVSIVRLFLVTCIRLCRTKVRHNPDTCLGNADNWITIIFSYIFDNCLRNGLEILVLFPVKNCGIVLYAIYWKRKVIFLIKQEAKQYKLKNGIRIVLEKIPHVYSASVGIWIYAGSADESMENNGIAHMIEHMLFKGTTGRTATQLADETAETGGEISAYTSKEFTSLYATVLSEHLPKIIEIMGDMLNNSLFDEAELEKEKNIVMDEIDMYKDSPEDVVHEMLQMKVWDKHPLGFLISGEKDIVKGFSSKQLKEFVKDYYVGENIVISVAGNFNEDAIMKQLEAAFSEIAPTGKPKKTVIPEFTPAIYLEEKDIEQIHINFAFPASGSRAEDRYAYAVMNNILGGGVNSRIFMKIREELGLTYAIYSYGCSFMDAGLFHICASLNPEQFPVVMKECMKVLRELKENGPTDKELIASKEQIKTDLLLQCESTKAIMNQNAKSIMLFDEIIPIEHTIKIVNAITQKDIIDCLNGMMDGDGFGIAIAGNINSETMTEENIKKFMN